MESRVGIKIEGLAPLLSVSDMPTSIRFYSDVLGFEVVGNSPIVKGAQGEYFHWALLRLDGTELMLNTAYDEGQRPAAPDRAHIRAHGDTCIYFGCPDVDGAYQHLQSHGIKTKPPAVAPYGMKQLYVRDPDGYNLCFQWPAEKK
jgi:glyoxylase I family protein